ncbi:MAG: protein kinase [Phycisphaeraceae bacterium]|nr:protein kinase [Phycisphaeraceae bacterium]
MGLRTSHPDDERMQQCIDAVLATPPEHRREVAQVLCGDDPELLARVLEAVSEVRQEELERRVQNLLGDEAAGSPDAGAHDVSGERRRIGPYVLLEKLGEGGFGEVFVAEQREPMRRLVALKVIKTGMASRDIVARFEAERQALALMDHPNIARVFDGGTTALGQPYFVMELVRGVPITTYCDDERLNIRDRLRLVIDVCSAVQHAHQKGIIHRDLKPANVLVTLVDGRPIPKVIDFGIAKAIEAPLTDKTIYTEFLRFVGSPAYMSPERIGMSGQDVDTRSDIYSLGVLIYELVTGSTPVDTALLMRGGLLEMQNVLQNRGSPRPSERLSTLAGERRRTVAAARMVDADHLARSVRGEIDAIVMKALDPDRSRRYSTAESLGADLHRFLRGEPILARLPSPVYIARKFIARNRTLAAAAALVICALVGGLSVAMFALHAAKNARDEAQLSQARAEAQAELLTLQEASARQREYAAIVTLAGDLLEHGSPVEAKHLLQTASVDLRGWEWHHLDTIARGTVIAGGERAKASIDWLVDARATIAARGPPNVVFGSLSSALDGPSLEGVYASAWLESVRFRSEHDTISLRIPLPRWVEYHAGILSRDGRSFAVATKEGAIIADDVIDAPWSDIDPRSRHERLLGLSGPIREGAFSPDGHWFAAMTNDGLLVEWPLESQAGRFDFAANGSAILDSTLSPDGRTIFVASWGFVRAFDAATGRALWTTCYTGRYVDAIAHIDEGRRLIAIGHNQEKAEIAIIECATGKIEGIWSAAPDPDVPAPLHPPLLDRRAALAIDLSDRPQPRIVTGMLDGTFASIDMLTLQVSTFTPPNWPQSTRLRMAVRVPGMAILIGRGLTHSRNVLLVFDADIERLIWDVPVPDVRAVASSPDGSFLAVANTTGGVQVWNTSSRTLMWQQELTEAQVAIAWMHDPALPRVVSADGRGTLTWFDARTGASVFTRRSGMKVVELHAVPDGSALLATGSRQDIVRFESGADPAWFAERAVVRRAETSFPRFGPTAAIRETAIREHASLASDERDLLSAINRGFGEDLNFRHSDSLILIVTATNDRLRAHTLPILHMLTEARPSNAAYHVTLGMCALRLGEVEIGERALARAQELLDAQGKPRGFWFELGLARLYHLRLDAEMARTHLQAARTLFDANPALQADRLNVVLLNQVEELLKNP